MNHSVDNTLLDPPPTPDLGSKSQSSIYYCRVGKHGQVGRFRDVQRKNRDRNEAVLVRTTRGVEPATVLSAVSFKDFPTSKMTTSAVNKTTSETIAETTDGKILRKQTPEDDLLQKQLNLSAEAASVACQAYLDVNRHADCLLDVEPMMDGKTLYFHFVGVPSESLTQHLQKLAEIFQQEVQSSQFAKLLEHGCGPGCGTEEKGGCGDDGACTVCVVAKACATKSPVK